MNSLSLLPLLFSLLVFPQLSIGASPNEWQSRTIYQLLTDRFARSDGSTNNCNNLSGYCGGSFNGIINHLDYIQGMGFDSIWISPVITNTNGGYHGYWAQNFYTINPNFGSADDLKNLAKALHNRGMYLMVDIVANHVGPVGDDFSSIYPFNVKSDYHPDCEISNYQCFTNEIYNCRLSGLPDLDQSNNYVNGALMSWIKDLIRNYSIDGLRIDTVPYINQTFWSEFSQAAGVYSVGEVEMDVGCCVAYQQTSLPGILSYPMFFTLRDVFQNSNSMNEIQDQWNAYQQFPHVEWLGNFIDNHDHPRFLNNNNGKVNQYKNALIYVLYSAGIPIVYYGTEQLFSGGNDPNCREALWPSQWNQNTDMYNFLNKAISNRKKFQVWNYPQVQRYSTTNFYAFTRGPTFVALTNSNNPVSETITYDSYTDGTKLCNIFDSSDCVVVQNKKFTVTISDGLPKVYYPAN